MRNLAAYIPGPVNVILPLALLLLKAAFKVAIDQQVSGTIIVRSLIAAPVDIIFLSLSFLCAFILIYSISRGNNYGNTARESSKRTNSACVNVSSHGHFLKTIGQKF